ncbi:hypothetical protein EG68_04596 [Paragonimus skrjabini miyazakii]|uniref:Ferritin n=1 Tax=Paragonimus skrjabini miyazakii TaxID=59628 RepID=A0A8S9YZS5_9TREM|nr:hypothetical protein EG68_04596 [Paragonimus skrjabini miyazakii]
MAAKTALLLLIATYLTLGWAKELTDPFILGVELESGFNDQVMIEYEAFYIYENMAAYFSRPEVGLHGFAKFFRKAADEEIEHARKMSDFINKRNGRVILRHIVPPGETVPENFASIKEAISLAIQKELQVSRSVASLHLRASKLNDAQAQHFLDDFLMEQVESTSKLRSMKARLELCDSAVFLMDQELQS